MEDYPWKYMAFLLKPPFRSRVSHPSPAFCQTAVDQTQGWLAAAQRSLLAAEGWGRVTLVIRSAQFLGLFHVFIGLSQMTQMTILQILDSDKG